MIIDWLLIFQLICCDVHIFYGSTNKFPPFFNKKLRIYCERTAHNVLFKVMTTASHYFFHFSDSMWIPRRKNASSFEAIQSSIFGIFIWCEVLRQASSIGTSDSRKEQCLENTADGVELPIWMFLSRFWPAPQHVVEHYHAGE